MFDLANHWPGQRADCPARHGGGGHIGPGLKRKRGGNTQRKLRCLSQSLIGGGVTLVRFIGGLTWRNLKLVDDENSRFQISNVTIKKNVATNKKQPGWFAHKNMVRMSEKNTCFRCDGLHENKIKSTNISFIWRSPCYRVATTLSLFLWRQKGDSKKEGIKRHNKSEKKITAMDNF